MQLEDSEEEEGDDDEEEEMNNRLKGSKVAILFTE